uniref:Iroquois-class homeodomain protein domain-containing protein n=2 Tax=Timema TaxID=61471 RepID=A0A7R9IC15_9NEOP|nr:unnamed protein product [Timema bartmani]CAD7453644.1 unnamed protein product [Timema tahoe]
MLGGLKDEMGKGGGRGDCGVPIPATKPKIWSLADTAACKTPPPPPSQQHQQQPWVMPNSGCNMNMGMNMSMNSFALPSTGMSPSAAAPYSRYGGLISGPYGGGGGGMGGGGTGGCSVSVGASGFPEVQTDTPPQTPPNMKLPSVAGNLTQSSCFGGSVNPSGVQNSSGSYQGHHNSYLNNYGRLQHSPQKERQSGNEQSYQHHLNNGNHGGVMMGNNSGQGPNEGTAFKPFYKSSQPMSGGFVSPV